MSSGNGLGSMLMNVCPHWYWPMPDYVSYSHSIMMEIEEIERCRICGKRRVHAKVPEPHPTRDKEQLRDDLQEPGFELVIEEWLPYGSKGP